MASKTCGRCNTERPLDSFHVRRYKSGRVGYQAWCQPCSRTAVRENRAKNPTVRRERERQTRAQRSLVEKRYREHKRYGLAPGEYDAMLLMQGGRCAVCAERPTEANPLCVDHDHKCCPERHSCGKCVRGLVCRLCNWMPGNSQDTAARLRAGAAYLERY